MYVDDRPTARAVLVDGIRFAAGTLTAVPVHPPSSVDVRTGRVAMVLAPVAVLPLSIVVGVVCWSGIAIGLPVLTVAVLAIGVLILGNRCFHLDGLADTVDGLTASYDRERALEIMHRSDTGPAGAAAIVVVLALQVTALATVVGRPYGWLLAGIAVSCSRGVLALSCHRSVPAARRSGLAVTVAATVPSVATTVVALGAAALMGVGLLATGRPWWQGVAAIAAAALCAAVLLHRCVRRIGGVTGDVLGASIELAFAVLLTASAAS